MPESEILLTMAEVAAAFAGFTALASVFEGRRTRDHPRISSLFLRVMIEASLMVVFFSLLPLILEQTPLASRWLWRVSAGGCSTAWLLAVFLFVRKGRKVQHETHTATSGWYTVSALISVILGNTALLLTATGIIDSWAGGAYLLGLFFALLNAGLSFARYFFGAYDRLPA